MIPIRDANPSRTIPLVNIGLIVVNVLVFLFELTVSSHLDTLFFQFGVVPSRVMAFLHGEEMRIGVPLTLVTSMFLHGGWLHLIGNMLFLYVFGDNVEDKLGHVRYVVFYLLGGTGAALTQVLVTPSSTMPMVGASGAIAAVLGAYVIMFPRAKIVAVIPIFIFLQLIELPAYMFLGIWFLLQMISGLGSLGIGADAGGVAWWAHIGGFASGAILLPFHRARWR